MLEQVSLFTDLPAGEILRLEALCQERTVPKNTLVINEGDETDCLYIVRKGRASALRSDEAGRQFVVNRFGPGDTFGEISLFDSNARSASVVSNTRCTLMVMPRKSFFEFATRYPDIYRNMIRTLLAKLRRATDQISELAFLDVYGRLVRFLIENQTADGVIEEKLTHQELAAIVGSSRETVCRIVNQLVDGGYLSRERGRMCIRKKLPYHF
jgi:CRP/FNR family cyclic AMP-dependent transcriptional regulator